MKALFPALITLAALQFTNIIDFMIMMPLAPQLERVMHINTAEFGLLVSIYALSSFFSGIAATFYIDNFDRKKSLLVIYTFFIIGTFLCGTSASYYGLLFARAFTGVFGGIMGAQIYAIIGDIVPFKNRAQAMSIVMAGFSAASILGVPIAIYVAAQFSWKIPFIALAILGIPFLLLAIKVIPNVRNHLDTNQKNNIKNFYIHIFSNKNALFSMLLMIVLMLGHFLVVPHVSNFMVSNVGFSEQNLVYIYLIGGAVTIFTSPLIGKLADKYGKKRFFVLFLLLTCVPIYLITHLQNNQIGLALLVTTLFFTFSSGRFIPANAIVSETVQPSMRGRFMSLISAIQQLGVGLSSFISGFIIFKNDHGIIKQYDLAGYLSILLSISTLYFMHKIKINFKQTN
jgi:predicted MFS family arabinose efflux permease